MWTGFRVALGGAQERYGVSPDLACFSKAIANGMPLSVLTGRRDVMQLLERDAFFFTTFGGEALSLAAAKATIEVLRDRDVPGHLERQGRRLRDGVNDLARELGMGFVSCAGLPARTITTFAPTNGASALEMKSLAQQELLRRGVLWGGFHNMSFAHGDAEVDYTLECWREVLGIVGRAVADGRVREALRGEPVEPVFRKTSQFHTQPRRA
jgi:glutamate-1-semialdehyde aminotransferase